MKSKDVVYGILSLVLLYVFLYHLVFAMFNPVKPAWSALFLTVMLTLFLLINPLVNNSAAFQKVFSRK